MLLHRTDRRRRHGIAAVEAALALPLLVAVMVGVWEVGRLVYVAKIVDNAARDGARLASSGLQTIAQCKQYVSYYLTQAGIPSSNAVITVQNLTHSVPLIPPATSSSDDPLMFAFYQDQIQVTISYPFKDARWLALNMFVADTAAINVTAHWMSMANNPFQINTTIPSLPQ
jgi:Flp pilus assembly protein TadG